MNKKSRIYFVCQILFKFNDEKLDMEMDNWKQTPNKIIEFVGKYLLEEETYKLIPPISKENWIKHLNESLDIVQTHKTTNMINVIKEQKLPQVIGITGKKYNGKDTVSDYICIKYGFNKIAFADPLKQVCKIIFEFNDDQLYGNKKEEIDMRWNISPRKIFQYIGTDLIRKQMCKIIPDIQDNFWVKCLIETMKCELKLNPTSNFMISDIRFQNEIDSIKKEFSHCQIIRVVRPSVNLVDNHESETMIDNLKNIDNELINNGTLEDLYNMVEQNLFI